MTDVFQVTPAPNRDNTHLVFVYGSLLRGLRNHHFLENQEFLGSATTQGAYYALWNLGSFPGLTEVGECGVGESVSGELYRVSEDCLAELDGLESNGTLYQRKLIFLSGQVEPVWCYFLLIPEANLASRFDLVEPHGKGRPLSWRDHRETLNHQEGRFF